MPRGRCTFFGLDILTPLVQWGEDLKLPRGEDGEARHTVEAVYPVLVLQICSDYPGLPDVRTMTMTEIRFFYEGLRKRLKEGSKPRK